MTDPQATLTPNVVIPNGNARYIIGAGLYVISLIAGAASIVLGFWPELASLEPDPARVIATVNAIVSLLAGAFGITVTLPNVPRS